MYQVYEGTVTITVTVPRQEPAAKAREVRVRLIACKEGTCLLPSVIKVK